MFKTNTYRVNYIGPGVPDSDDGSGPITQGRTWQELLDDKIEAGATFIHIRFNAGYDELTVREPI